MSDTTVRRSESVAKLAAALCAAQAEIEPPTKNKQNPHLKNWYADLSAVLKAVLPVLNRHKLTVTQLPCELAGEPAMTTILLHESGEWLETTMRVRPTKADPQSVGSAQSYARRYSLQAVAGVAADDDDDGSAASRPAATTARQQPAAKPAPAAARTTEPPRLDPDRPPADGAALHTRLRGLDAYLASEKVCDPGALLWYVTDAGHKAGYSANLNEWSGPAIPFALAAAKDFIDYVRNPPPPADPETAAERAAIEAEGEDPAVHDGEAARALFKATGTTLADALTWVNAHLGGAAYTPGTKYLNVSVEHRRALVAALREKPGGRVD